MVQADRLADGAVQEQVENAGVDHEGHAADRAELHDLSVEEIDRAAQPGEEGGIGGHWPNSATGT
ncbi:hypothetical protein Kisp01_00550 [Kineosporia sp. NBRC 101677]|nr:hypothetical protein Kisp01_00550 [Kineosporia sp. NBRC 101677]